MLILMDAYIKKSLIFFVFLKIITIIILIWIDHPYDDVFTCGGSIQNKYKGDSALNIILKRYMSESVNPNELDRSELYKNFPYNYDNKRTRFPDDYISIYGRIKNKDSTKLKLYKCRYRNRYSKKKGLAKLDCYCEKKIFDNIDYINNLAESWQGGKMTFTKKILKKIAIRFILFAILPVIGITLNVLFKAEGAGNRIIDWCGVNHTEENNCPRSAHYHIDRHLLESFLILSNVLWYTSIIIFIIFVIYIFIKVIKYEKLKSGKGKMGLKEYCRFCKDAFNNEIS